MLANFYLVMGEKTPNKTVFEPQVLLLQSPTFAIIVIFDLRGHNWMLLAHRP